MEQDGQHLDLVTIIIDSCYQPESITSNCTFQYRSGVIPTTSVDNFLIQPSVISVSILNFYRTSPLVLSLQITAQIFKEHELIQTVLIHKGSENTEVYGLSPATLYSIQFTSVVTYSNGLQFNTTTSSMHSVTTQRYIGPSSTVQNVMIQVESGSILIQWESIPVNDRGNLPITRLEIHYSSLIYNFETQIICITGYNADTNTPSSYTLALITSNINYTVEMRACTSLSCSNFSNPIIVSVPLSIIATNDSNIIEIIVPVIVATILILIILLLLLAILITITMCVIGRVKRHTYSNKTETDTELKIIDEIVPKDFRIDESKIDMTGSVFLGSGVSGSVVTAKYFNINVAVKLVTKSVGGMNSVLSDFHNEMKFLNTNTQHMNIIRFFGLYDNPKKNHIR